MCGVHYLGRGTTGKLNPYRQIATSGKTAEPPRQITTRGKSSLRDPKGITLEYTVWEYTVCFTVYSLGTWCRPRIHSSIKQRNLPKNILDDLLVTPVPLHKQERFSHKVHKACLLTSKEHINYLKKKEAAKNAKGKSGTGIV